MNDYDLNHLALDSASSPKEIERRSFEIIDAEVPEPRRYSGALWEIARRCIHAMGDPAIANDLRLQETALQSAMTAMRDRCVIYTDTRMLAAGLVARRMDPLGIKIVALMDLPGIGELAAKKRITRARCGMEMIAEKISGQIVAIGNAPTALLALLEELRRKPDSRPALIVGMPVGFVNAAQSKQILHESNLPHFTLLGRKGGSAVAAACLNAIAEILLREKKLDV